MKEVSQMVFGRVASDFFYCIIQIISMSTESPSAIQQTAAILTRLNRQISTFLDMQQSPASKKEPFQQNGYSPLYQISVQTESFVKMLMKKINDCEKNYEAQLQKLEDRLRKHAKSHCEMKLYCEFLQQELRGERKWKKQQQAQLQFLTIEYNKQIETLKTELSNAMITRMNEQKPLSIRRDEGKQMDTLAKIKKRLINIGNIQFSEPVSCINTVREAYHQEVAVPQPYSQPTSIHNSPISSVHNQELKQTKPRRSSNKTSKGKKRQGSKSPLSKDNSSSQTKLKVPKRK